MERINKLCNMLFSIFLIAMLCTVFSYLIYIIQTKILKTDYLNIFNYSIFRIETGSMEPNIKIGDLIIVKLTKNINEGDVIVYEDENKAVICHRLIKKDKEKLITKGDNNNSEDDPIYIEDVIGKVIKRIPKIGFVQKNLKNSKIFSLIIILIAISAIIPNRFYKNFFKR